MEGKLDLDYLLGRRLFPTEVWVNIALRGRCRRCGDHRAHGTGCDRSYFSRWYCIPCFAVLAESMESADTAQSAYWNPVIGFTRRVLRAEFVAIDSDSDGIAELHIDYTSDGWMHSVTREGSSRISPSLIAHWRRRCVMQKLMHTLSLIGLPIDPSLQLDIDLQDRPMSNFHYAMEDQFRQRHGAQVVRLDAELIDHEVAMIPLFATLAGHE
jgi:hypothetical protein